MPRTRKNAGKGRKFCPHCHKLVPTASKTCPQCNQTIPTQGVRRQARRKVSLADNVSTALQAANSLIRLNGGCDGAKQSITLVSKFINVCGSATDARAVLESFDSVLKQNRT